MPQTDAAQTPEAVFAAFRAQAEEAAGVKLFTVMTLDREAGLARRVYSSDPVSYPVSGAKPIVPNAWFAHVADQGEVFVANDYEGVAAVFFDHELIRSLGCESVVNLPVNHEDTVVGTVNLLHGAGWYTSERVAALEALLAERHGDLVRACRADQPGA